MWLVSVCALMVIVQSAITDSFGSLLLAAVSVIAAVLIEFLFLYKDEKTYMLKDGSVVASALIFTMLLPNEIAPIYAILGIIFAIAVIKHCFGGLGSNWLNPAAGGWLFVRLSWPGVFNRALEGSVIGSSGYVDFLSGNPAETNAGYFLNNSVFSFLGTELPSSYQDLFALSGPGIIADRGIIMLLAGTILITAVNTGRTWIPAVWLAVFVLLTRFAGSFAGAGPWSSDVLFALFSGGTLASAFILAADPATGAKPQWLTIIFAAAGGFLAWLFRFPGYEPYGAIISVLVINALLPIARNIEIYWKEKNK